MIQTSNATAVEQSAKNAANPMSLPCSMQASILAGGLSGQGLWASGLAFGLSSCFEGGIALDSPSYENRLDPTINRSGRHRRLAALPS